jgi:hypothetical protein
MVGANGVEAVPSDDGTGWLLRAVPDPEPPNGEELAAPKPPVVPCPLRPKSPPPVAAEPKADVLFWLKLKPEPVLLLAPKPVFVVFEAPKPAFGFPNAVFAVPVLPNRLPPVLAALVDVANGFGFGPKREVAFAVLFEPKPVEVIVSWGSFSGMEDSAGEEVDEGRALGRGMRVRDVAIVRPTPAKLDASRPFEPSILYSMI